jgi:hypothetical protein
MEETVKNLDLISIVINIVGTIVIVASLLFLVKQTSLTNKIARGESFRELVDSFNEIVARYSNNESIILIQRALGDYNSLKNAEKARFNLIFIIPHLQNCEQFFELNNQGLIEDRLYSATINFAIAVLKTNGGKQSWIELQLVWNPEFAKFINKEIELSEHIPPISDVLTFLKFKQEN